MDLGINLILKCKPKLKPLSIFECICLGFDLGLVLGFLGFLGLGLGLDSKTHVFFGGKTYFYTELHQALSPTTTQNTDESNHAQNRSSPFLTHLFATRRLHLTLTRRDLDRADQVGERRGDVLDRIDEQHLGVGLLCAERRRAQLHRLAQPRDRAHTRLDAARQPLLVDAAGRRVARRRHQRLRVLHQRLGGAQHRLAVIAKGVALVLGAQSARRGEHDDRVQVGDEAGDRVVRIDARLDAFCHVERKHFVLLIN